MFGMWLMHRRVRLDPAGNYVFMMSGVVLLGFLGAVHARLRQVDRSGALAAIAVAAGTLLALVWPFAGVLHDVALDTCGSTRADANSQAERATFSQRKPS